MYSFRVCGCKWQNLSYQKTILISQEEVYNNIKTTWRIENFETLPIFGFRSKNISTEIKWSFLFLTLVGLLNTKSVPKKISNKDVLFPYPGMWSKNFRFTRMFLQEAPSNDLRLAVRNYAIKMV